MNVEDIRTLAKAATQGRWQAEEDALAKSSTGTLIGIYIKHTRRQGRICETFSNCMVSNEQALANARFIAAANPGRVLRLINQLEKAQAEVRALRRSNDQLGGAA